MLNIKKSNSIIFHPHQKKIDYQVNLQIFDNDSKTFLPLKQKSYMYLKYLGVLKLIQISAGNIILDTLLQR